MLEEYWYRLAHNVGVEFVHRDHDLREIHRDERKGARVLTDERAFCSRSANRSAASSVGREIAVPASEPSKAPVVRYTTAMAHSPYNACR